MDAIGSMDSVKGSMATQTASKMAKQMASKTQTSSAESRSELTARGGASAHLIGAPERVFLYDTTLRDGAQTRGIDFTQVDKVRIARALDALGVDYIEGGWPGANAIDDGFFADPPELKTARLTAFGMTRRSGRSADNDETLRALLEAKASVVCMVGKSWKYQAEEILKVSGAENRRMISESLALMRRHKDEVFFDAEHFFDGWAEDRDFSLSCLEAALEGGADWLVLCDTNGGVLPERITETIAEVRQALPEAKLGIHLHNDTETAVAGSLAALGAGVRQVQGTCNGFGERCGNANLIALIGSLALKTRWQTRVTPDRLQRLSEVSGLLNERVGRLPDPGAAYVGVQAFAHKGGLHASAVAKDPRSYEHIEPEWVGNHREVLVSDQAGRANVLTRLRQLGMKVDDPAASLKDLVKRIKEREAAGYSYEGADGSLWVLAQRFLHNRSEPFLVERFRLISERRRNALGEQITESEATVSLIVGTQEQQMTVALGQSGPVDALNRALRKALLPLFPSLEPMVLSDYKVRILNSSDGTRATTRVLIDWTDNGLEWTTVGVSPNILNASLEAIVDGVFWRLFVAEDSRKAGKADKLGKADKVGKADKAGKTGTAKTTKAAKAKSKKASLSVA